jgi:hypothetical protein
MHRRDFLSSLASGAVATRLVRGGNTPAAAVQRQLSGTRAARLERIAISTWSLRNYFRATRREDFNFPGPMLALLDFPEMIVDKYNVRHFEFCATHFASSEPAYLRELKYQLVHTRSTIVNLAVDIKELGREGTFSDPERIKRAAAVEAAKKWVDVAHMLGARSVCCGPGKADPKKLARTVESYRALAPYALAKGVHVIVENQEGFGTDHPEEMIRLFKLVGSGRIGALPNFSNFPDESTRQKGLKLLFPYARTVCHVTGLEFAPDGAEKGYGFPKAMEIAKRAGFRGIYTIEFTGSGDPYAGIQKTLEELVRYL